MTEDEAHKSADKALADMKEHIHKIYSGAAESVGKNWAAFVERSTKEIGELQKIYDKAKQLEDETAKRKAGAALKKAKKAQTVMNARYKDLTAQTAREISRVNETAAAYVNGELPKVYAENYNALEGAVDGVGGYSFTLTSPETVRNLATKDDTLLPYKVIDGVRDVRWNTTLINSQVLQGILAGEPMDAIAGRLANVLPMNEASAIRNARTSVTSAECKGRLDSYVQAESDGIILEKKWIATLTGDTRNAHRLLDGKTAPVNEPFDSELGPIMYPGDIQADPANVYNCRCTISAKVKGFRKLGTSEIVYVQQDAEKPAAQKAEAPKPAKKAPPKAAKPEKSKAAAKPTKKTKTPDPMRKYTYKELEKMPQKELDALARALTGKAYRRNLYRDEEEALHAFDVLHANSTRRQTIKAIRNNQKFLGIK